MRHSSRLDASGASVHHERGSEVLLHRPAEGTDEEPWFGGAILALVARFARLPICDAIRRSSVVERSAVNRVVVGSNPTAGAIPFLHPLWMLVSGRRRPEVNPQLVPDMRESATAAGLVAIVSFSWTVGRRALSLVVPSPDSGHEGSDAPCRGHQEPSRRLPRRSTSRQLPSEATANSGLYSQMTGRCLPLASLGMPGTNSTATCASAPSHLRSSATISASP